MSEDLFASAASGAAWQAAPEPSRALDAWREEGAQLALEHSNSQWRIGDWWNAGQRWCRARKMVIDSEHWSGPSWQHCHDCSWVCRAFPLSRRRGGLSFEHHRVLAALPPQEADRWLDWCLSTNVGMRRFKPASVAMLKSALAARPARQLGDDASCSSRPFRSEFPSPAGLPKLSKQRQKDVIRLEAAIASCARDKVPLLWVQYLTALSYGAVEHQDEP